MALTTARPRTTSPPPHWESTGRFALGLVSLVLGTALAWSWGDYPGAAGLVLLAALGAAVLYPDVAERVHHRIPGLAVPTAAGVVAAALLSALLFGSILTALFYALALAGLAVVASPLFHVGPRRLR